MLRLILFLAAVLLIASGLAWLADRPGQLLLTWEGYELETSVFRAVVILAALLALALFLWSLFRQILATPAHLSRYLTRRRQRRGLDALSGGMIAVGAGDRNSATRYALQARRALPNEPLTQLLRAQAAQLSGDRAAARRIFEGMLGSPDTEQLGLRGLFLEAIREGEPEAARQFAERAARLNPNLSWPLEAQFDLQCKASDWAAAVDTLARMRKIGEIEKPLADRRRAVLLTAQAQALEESDPGRVLELALEAHTLAPDLIPAAAIAGRALAAKGQTSRTVKVIQKTWARSPHPDLAVVYAYARIGDSPRDRLTRMKQLAQMRPSDLESAVAVAGAAIEARAFDAARDALQPFLGDALTGRVARLMARIEAEEKDDAGRVREWLMRAGAAQPDPAWTADGAVLDAWAPVSPVTGALDAVQWRCPVTALQASRDALSGDVDAWLTRDLDAVLQDAEAEETVVEVEPASAGAGPGPADMTVRSTPPPPAPRKAAPVLLETLVAPDDPGAGGDDLVPDIRTSRKAPGP